MNFFCKKSHFEDWVKEMDLDKNIYFKLNVKEAIDASKMIFRVDK
nr:hypothetical protein [Clostridium hydrogeniformans]